MSTVGVWAMLVPVVAIFADACDRKRNDLDRGAALFLGALGLVGFAFVAIGGVI